ncbi:MAG: zinc ribbon domain-containing protein [Thermodesulfobacteriota bacterium]
MFIIAGISPRIQVLDGNPRLCPSCGLARAYLKRADGYLSLFFIPLFRVRKGEPFIFCDRCETVVPEQGAPLRPWQDRSPNKCSGCGKTLDKEFLYCPNCGKKI